MMKITPTPEHLMRYTKPELVRMLLQAVKSELSKSGYLMDLISRNLRGYQFAEVEYFRAITINAMGIPIKIHEISKGTMDHTIISPRDVFREALRDNARSVIGFHNHPSWIIKPSEDDNRITKKLSGAATFIGIDLLDHIFIGSNAQYFNYSES